MFRKLVVVILFFIAQFTVVQAEDIKLRVLNWGNYIDETVLGDFRSSTGITVDYQTFDDEKEFFTAFYETDEPWDVIFLSDNLLSFLLSKRQLQPLNKSQLSSFSKLDPDIMKQLSAKDPGNIYAVPYMWGTTGLGINWTAAEKVGVNRRAIDSWSPIFDASLRSSFARCGIAAINARDELFAAALRYQGSSINSTDEATLSQAANLIGEFVAQAKYLHSNFYYRELAEGKLCLVLGYSGDIATASYEAEGQELEYIVPSQGASVWFDVMVIPAMTTNINGAHAFIDYLSSPRVAAKNTNHNAYPNPVPASEEWVNKEILEDPAVYPSEQIKTNLEAFTNQSSKTRRLKRKLWVVANCRSGAYCEVPFNAYGY